MNYLISLTRIEDLPEIVSCHKDAFPDSLSTKQGDRFISKMMEWYIVDERGVLFHIKDDKGDIAGYCGGIITRQPGLLGAVSSISQYAFNQFLLAYLRKPWLIVHPENIKKAPYIVRNLRIKLGLRRKVKKIDQSGEQELFIPFMGLVVIGVRNSYHGKGFGSKLLREFENLARNQTGIELIKLSVKSSNTKAIKSYLRNGWEIKFDGLKTKGLEKRL